MPTLLSIITNFLEALVLVYFVGKYCISAWHQRILSTLMIIILTLILIFYDYYQFNFIILLILKISILFCYTLVCKRVPAYLFICGYACIIIYICDTAALLLNKRTNLSLFLLIPLSKILGLILGYILNKSISNEYQDKGKLRPLYDLTIFLLLIVYALILQIFLKEQYDEATILLILIFFTLSISCFYFLYEQNKKLENREHELLLLNQEYKFQQNNYNQIEQTIIDITKIKHDMNYLLLSFKQSLLNNDSKKVLNEIDEQLIKLENTYKVVNSGNRSLDYLIMKNIDWINSLKITFHTNYDNYPIPLKQLDLYMIVSNILENAIIYCSGALNKEIIINRGIQNDYYCIKVKNTIKSSFNNDTIKNIVQDPKIKNVFEIIEKYNGRIIYEYDDDYLSCTILIPLQHR